MSIQRTFQNLLAYSISVDANEEYLPDPLDVPELMNLIIDLAKHSPETLMTFSSLLEKYFEINDQARSEEYPAVTEFLHELQNPKLPKEEKLKLVKAGFFALSYLSDDTALSIVNAAFSVVMSTGECIDAIPVSKLPDSVLPKIYHLITTTKTGVSAIIMSCFCAQMVDEIPKCYDFVDSFLDQLNHSDAVIDRIGATVLASATAMAGGPDSLSPSIFTALIENVTSQNDQLFHRSYKAIKFLLKGGHFSDLSYVVEYLESYPSFQNRKYEFYNILRCFLAPFGPNFDEEEENPEYDFEIIREIMKFISTKIGMQSISMNEQSNALGVAGYIIDTNLLVLEDTYEDWVDIAINIINTDMSNSLGAAFFLYEAVQFPNRAVKSKVSQLIPALLASNDYSILDCAGGISSVTKQFTKDCYERAISLIEQGDGDESMRAGAILLDSFDEHFTEICNSFEDLTPLIDFCSTTTNEKHFNLCLSVIQKALPLTDYSDIDSFMHSLISGNMEILHGAPPAFHYLEAVFSFITKVIERYPTKTKWITTEVIGWVLHSPNVTPSLYPLIAGIEAKHFDSTPQPKLSKVLLYLINSEMDDLEVVCKAIWALRKAVPNVFDRGELEDALLNIMEEMEDDGDIDGFGYIAAITLSMYIANETELCGDLIDTMIACMPFDAKMGVNAEILEGFSKLMQKGDEGMVDVDVCSMLVDILFRNRSERERLGINEETVKEMKMGIRKAMKRDCDLKSMLLEKLGDTRGILKKFDRMLM